MAYDWARLKEIAALSTSAAVLYPNPASKKTYVKLIILHNIDSVDHLVTLWVVPDSGGSEGAEGDSNQFFSQLIPAGRTVTMNFEQPGIILVDENEGIQGKADIADKVTIQIYGATE